ncbi:hypothetical protein PR202_gb01280 [Eleusine coracana subsp. coracana]|uniref:Uncharacterized protein n=1 Tax=Eleusine coracana subsp. coracana TaxID=191504 RepID=A0AAV5DWA4_ELECO|nr:hypothetical protein PR202_gb01280 [Eleusine coracana subsp. coracana]
MAAAARRILLLPCILSLLLAAAATICDSDDESDQSMPLSLFLASVAAAGSRGGPVNPSAYEKLEGFGFPRASFRACEFEVQGRYRIKYSPVISGIVEAGSIRNLRGVSVRMFLLDWGIDRVVVEDSGHLMFYVGPLSQAFPAEGFEESPECQSCRHSRSWDGMAAMVDAMAHMAAM